MLKAEAVFFLSPKHPSYIWDYTFW